MEGCQVPVIGIVLVELVGKVKVSPEQIALIWVKVGTIVDKKFIVAAFDDTVQVKF